jgi:hypothetical protein
MAGDDKTLRRPVVVIGLVLLALVALRGYLPGAPPPQSPRNPPGGGPGSIIAVLTMLGLSIAVIVISIVTQTRRPGAASSAEGFTRRFAGEHGRPRWRLLVVAAVILAVWAVVLILLMRWRAEVAAGDMPAQDTGTGGAHSGGPGRPPRPASGPVGGDVFVSLATATAVLVVASVVATSAGRRRVPPVEIASDNVPWQPEIPEGPDLARATEVGLAEIGDRSRDPREAIIACYVAMERELEKSPGTIPRVSDTPTEVLARAVDRRVLHAASATALVELFEEARFSPHVMNEGHRDAAVSALRRVQDALDASEAAP